MGRIEHVGDTGLRISLEFPNAAMRDGFEASLGSWIADYQRTETVYRLAKALAQSAEKDQSGEEDTGGHLFWRVTRVTDTTTGNVVAWREYTDLISFL